MPRDNFIPRLIALSNFSCSSFESKKSFLILLTLAIPNRSAPKPKENFLSAV